MSPENVAIKGLRRVVDVGVPPKQAHKFLFTRVGNEFVVEVGFFDFPALRDAIETAKSGMAPEQVPLHVSDRFVLSIQAARDLVDFAEEVKKALALGEDTSQKEKA
jgi:hypothetical protein